MTIKNCGQSYVEFHAFGKLNSILRNGENSKIVFKKYRHVFVYDNAKGDSFLKSVLQN